MMSIADILAPAQVDLQLQAATKEEAVSRVLNLLRGDPRVTRWEELSQAVTERNAPAIEESDCGILFAHGRTSSLTRLVMAVGRLAEPIACPEIQTPIRLIFLAGIPRAVDTEYLRVVGSIVRTLRDKSQRDRLLGVKEASRFIELLTGKEAN